MRNRATKDLLAWERLADLKTGSPQQRNVVLLPSSSMESMLLHTTAGRVHRSRTGGGIGWDFPDSIENAVISKEIIIDDRAYHTSRSKNRIGPASHHRRKKDVCRRGHR